eukprot:TRINITY_DN14385_c0_g3_i1.p1 TRINITY_DN14385_c0_g3~~TRINITY_DN14385_c0_g3_i1.p1  ORF type:complete len:360 (+),score=123.14 TRINITY_DN14385_c0_g3_i1:54-1082(+)
MASDGLEGISAADLRLLIEAQEKHAKQLHDLNARKELTLLSLQSRVQEAIETLETGKKIYSEHHAQIEAQTEFLEELRAKAKAKAAGASSSAAASPAPSPTKASAPAAAKAPPPPPDDDDDDDEDDDDDVDEDEDPEIVALQRRAAELRRELATLREAEASEVREIQKLTQAAGRVAQPAQPADDESDEESPEVGDGDYEEVQQLMRYAEELKKQLAGLQDATAAATATSPSPPSAGALAASPARAAANGGGGGPTINALAEALAASSGSSDGGSALNATEMAEALVSQAAPGLMEALGSLHAEKQRLEAMLHQEQSALETQLHQLQEMQSQAAMLKMQSPA